jgi:hypothetical protein
MRYGLLIISIALSLKSFGQKPMPQADFIPMSIVVEHQLVWAGSQNPSVHSPLDIPSFVAQKMGYSKDVNLILTHHRQSQTLDHYHFNIYFKNLRIHGGEVHAAVLPDGQVKLIQVPTQGFTVISGSMPSPQEALIAQQMLGAEFILNSETVLIPDGDHWEAAIYAELAGPETLHREVIVKDGEILYSNNLHKHHHMQGPNDTTVSVRVFDPDPLTTAQQTYGGKYVDNNDQNLGSLNTERQLRTTTFTFENGLFKPENDYVKIVEFSEPVTAQTAKPSPDFNFTRDKDQFEDVNVVYHITHFRKHIIALGYPNLPSYQIHVDAHALSGSDQSFFSTSIFPYRLYFGEGGVDDAEDADVILHEFAHAVINEAAPTGSKDTERKCIEEALCDYFAASYSSEVSSFGSNEVFNWDGHNEFWPGRSVSTSKIYSDVSFQNGNYYAHTDLMASSINDLRGKVGRNMADQLLLESLYFLTSSTRMPAFGRFMLISDSLLNGAANIRAVSESFVNHGILNRVISSPEIQIEDENGIRILSSHNFTDGGQVKVWSDEGLTAIRLFDLSGHQVLHMKLNGDQEVFIKGDDFKAGLYIISIETSTGVRTTQKLLRH